VSVVGTPSYPQNHGTAVSSCVAAGTNNNKGIAGIGYNTGIKGYHTSGFDLWNRIWQAYQEGIKIINVSWTGIGSYPNLLAVQEITNNGVVLVVAAGNSSTSTSHSLYANIPGVINVSGVWANNHHNGTNHAQNQWVDVCALSKNVAACVPGNTYNTESGTSFAAPQVAGVVALIRSINNKLSPAEIENIIKSTTDPIADAYLFPGLLGTGRVNAYTALQATPPCPTIVNFKGTITTPIIVNSSTTTIVSCGDINVQYVKVQNGAKLIFDADGDVNIISDFDVAVGSEFEIR
jgi:subtilisin family serine protease